MSLLIFSIQNAFRKKAVMILAILGVAFGIALVTFLLSLVAGMENRAERTLGDLSNRIMVSGRDALFGGLFLGMGTTPIPLSYVETIKSIPHVEKAYPQVSAIMRPFQVEYNMPLYGYGDQYISTVAGLPHNKIIEGTAPENDKEIIIGASLQKYMKFINTPYEIGNVYQFIVPEKGQEKVLELKVVGVYQTGNEVLDSAFSGSEHLARDIGKIPDEKVSSINVTVDKIDNLESVAQSIRNDLSGKKPEVQVVLPNEVLNPVKDVLDIFGRFLIAVSVVAVVVGALTIMVVMLLSVINRMREFGILKALGWTPANIIFLVLVESLVLSMLGAALGVALGYAGLVLARELIALDFARITWQTAQYVCLAGILIGVVGGIYPALRAGSAVPARILRGA
ncbi:ABC transporter permease protein [Desulfocucumis palustris]|uniref:ABC transporter permease protein n=1 Tax=Desulfocucumis palustris TaxID=1898651 RepID=A0A2L2XC55_9FIRM|nr:ABC transporter permease [Desulfocucumis palustris]GBF33909.1 ABC transporter permease protein [Desulfocucumis palustris]